METKPYREKTPKRLRPAPVEHSVAGRALRIGQALRDADLPYAPTQTDWLILGAVLSGAIHSREIARVAGVEVETVIGKMLQPRFARWLAEQVEAELPNRIGLVDLAVFARALKSGDVARARYLAERFGKMRRAARSQHLHLHLSLEKLSEEQLERLVEEKRRLLGLTNEEREQTQ